MSDATDRGRELLRATKASASRPHPALCLPAGIPAVGLLRPVVTRAGAIPPEDLRVLTEWRNRFVDSFLSEFDATEQRTERWLAATVGPDDSRILFMVDDLSGRTVGYIGLAAIDWASGFAEADSVVRGAEGTPGLYTRALQSMWRWGQTALGLTRLGVRVRSDNPARAFYERAGFRETHRVPLRQEQLSDGRLWVEDASLPAGELTLVHMLLNGEES